MKLKPIPGYPGYSITKDGRAKGKRGQWLRGGTVQGYKTYRLQTSERIHSTAKAGRLVLETYVGPCPEGKECCHRDGNRQNDNLENLYWGTLQENIADAIKCGHTWV